MNSRNVFSQDPKSSEAQIKRFAYKVMRRLHAAGGQSLGIEDIEQELWIAWLKASETFNPEYGVPFGAYLHRAMINHINTFADREVTRRHGEVIAMSLDKTIGDGDGASVSEIIPDEKESQDKLLEKKSALEAVLRRLSDQARAFVTMMVNPPHDLVAELSKMEARNEYAAKIKVAGALPIALTERIVFDLLGIERRSDRERVLSEIKNVIGAIYQ